MARQGKIDAEIHWEGDSKDVLSAFPSEVKATFGYSLRRLQQGELPACDTRSMSSVGEGVREMKTDDARTWYRVMYVARIQGVIYVLHAFEKDSRKTSKRDLEITRKRLKAVNQRLLAQAKGQAQEMRNEDDDKETQSRNQRRRTR
jgi:phage-related protein